MSGTAHTHFRSGPYDAARERAYHLSILLGEDLSAWTVNSVADGTPVALAWSTGIDALRDQRLPEHPVSVSFVALPEWSALVPDTALLPGTESRHLALVHGGLPTGALRDEPVRSLGATCVYTHDDVLERTVLERFPHARAMAMQALMVRGALARWQGRSLVLAHRGKSRTDLAIVGNGKLLLSNTYPTHSKEDLLYFTLLAIERTGMAPADVDLYLGGTHGSTAERKLLEQYVPKCFTAVPDPWPKDGLNEKDPADRWLAALEQFACA